MEPRKITEETLAAFARQLGEEERSPATLEKYLREVRQFAAFLGGREVTRELAAAWREELSARQSPATVNGKLTALDRLLAFLGWEDCRVKHLRVQRQLFRDSARELSREEYARELADTVAALRRHPCIGCWVPFNEGWGQFDARKATETLRALDPSRPVDEASGWFDRGGGDVHSIHNYFYPLRIRPNVRTVALSEYGGIAWPMPGHEPPRKTYGYGTAKSRAELTERYCDLQLRTILPQLKKGLSALVYTQLTDVEDEVNGLFTYDRTAIKPDAAAVRAVNEALEAEFEKAVKE